MLLPPSATSREGCYNSPFLLDRHHRHISQRPDPPRLRATGRGSAQRAAPRGCCRVSQARHARWRL